MSLSSTTVILSEAIYCFNQRIVESVFSNFLDAKWSQSNKMELQKAAQEAILSSLVIAN